MAFLKFFAFSLLGVCGLGLGVLAQPAAKPVSPLPPGKGPAIRALLLAADRPNLELVVIAGKQVSEPLLVGASGLSARVFPGAKSFSLALKDASAVRGYRSVAAITLPEAGDDFIVLLEPVAGDSFTPYLVNGRQQAFGADATLFFNASQAAIGAVLDHTKVLIAPRRVEVVAGPPPQGEIPYYQVELYAPDGGTPRMFSSSRWLHRPNGRNYVFIYQDKGSGRFGYQSVNETFARPPAP